MSSLRAVHDRWKSNAWPTNITDAPDLPWSQIGSGREHLVQELEKLYWEGARDELENIIRTLQYWRDPQCADITPEGDEDDHIHGYETFLDQLSRPARDFAARYNVKSNPTNATWGNAFKAEAIREVVLDTIATRSSARVKAEVRRNVSNTPKLSGDQQKARILLQAAGLLDIDKVIEHRTPWHKSEKRPGIPQLSGSATSSSSDKLVPLKCTYCSTFITGSMFIKEKHLYAPDILCEPCYWSRHYGDASFKKSYKHAVSAEGSQNRLSGSEADAKREGLLATTGKAAGASSLSRIVSRIRRNSKIDSVSTSLQDPANPQDPASWQHAIADATVAQAMADKGIHPTFRDCAERYPYANVHMALRIGPLVIENGVSNTRAGALISLRELPVYLKRFTIRPTHQRALSIGSDLERHMWQHQRVVTNPPQYKVIMKQVVGAPFSGVLSEFIENDQEQEVIDLLIAASQQDFDSSTLSAAGKLKHLESHLTPVLDSLKTLLQSRLTIYLNRVVQRLLDPNRVITWNPVLNNCQNFCNSLLDQQLFAPMVNGPPHTLPGSSPLYLMSFVCPPPQGYPSNKVTSKFDVPYGFIEEYLLRFYFGRYNDADMIDTLQEYWHDWGAFRAPLYPHQDLFPWDCTEAYGKCPTKCGDCNLAKHLWAFPLDSWSFVTLHLQRDAPLYPPQPAKTTTTPTQHFLNNRLKVLHSSSTLHHVAAAMAKSPRFCESTAWLHSPDTSVQSVTTPSTTRVKMGGIHRAQPLSHYFESAHSDHFFLAPWAGQFADQQKSAYEARRNSRMQLADFTPPVPQQLNVYIKDKYLEDSKY
ncbi:hypothetical protein FE257_012805 [Aspergillus nanangensis]|uniref:Uncharacterized protein n=1 Tax=Aspergillus nanangensis TaxID=2582783 RepID=A0AAD4GPT6_ASPNN|nr:hypothetical protein FE257_012805 [Aspergillus nanangensis]